MMTLTQKNSSTVSYTADDICHILKELVDHNSSEYAHEEIAHRFKNIKGPSLSYADVDAAFKKHESDGDAHPALRERITTTAYLLYLLAQEWIEKHNTDAASHPDLQAAITTAFRLHESSPTSHKSLADLIKKAEISLVINTTKPILGGGNLSGDRTLSASYATEVSLGIVQKASDIEVSLGKDNTKYTTPKNLGDFLKKRSVIPRNSILWWHGNINDLPEGYVVCDGKNSTPDLRNLRYLVGAGKTYTVGVSNPGNKSSYVTIGATTLTLDQIAMHQHVPPNMGEMTKYANYPYGNYGAYISGSRSSGGGANYPWLQPLGGNGSHTHSAALATAIPDPAFRALYVIKKI